MSGAGDASRTLAFAHIGDLRITDGRRRNYSDLLVILAQIQVEMNSQIDFVVLPGDCADNGRPEQYALIATALKMLSVPVYAIPGDHDMEPGSLDNFYAGLGGALLPLSMRLKRYRCLFLDFCGAGKGGPDFRLGDEQMRWLDKELADCEQAGETSLVFMHSYPADLRGEGEADALKNLAC